MNVLRKEIGRNTQNNPLALLGHSPLAKVRWTKSLYMGLEHTKRAYRASNAFTGVIWSITLPEKGAEPWE